MLDQATDEIREHVCKSINTSLDQIQKDVQKLKNWIKTQPHLPQCATNTMLTTYLIGCKNNMDQAKRKIDNYYTFRNRMPEFFDNKDPLDDKIKESTEEVRVFVLPKLSPEGHRVTMVAFSTGDSKKFDYTQLLKRSFMMEDVKMNREAFNMGLYVVFDAANFTASHILKFTPTTCKRGLDCVQDVLPTNMKKIIIINAPPYMNVVFNISKPFMKKKLLERFSFHTEGYEILDKYLPKSMLPSDYGGKEDTSEQLNEDWIRCLELNRDWLLNEGSMKNDETKRAKPAKQLIEKMEEITAKEIKSFKNLCID